MSIDKLKSKFKEINEAYVLKNTKVSELSPDNNNPILLQILSADKRTISPFQKIYAVDDKQHSYIVGVIPNDSYSGQEMYAGGTIHNTTTENTSCTFSIYRLNADKSAVEQAMSIVFNSEYKQDYNEHTLVNSIKLIQDGALLDSGEKKHFARGGMQAFERISEFDLAKDFKFDRFNLSGDRLEKVISDIQIDSSGRKLINKLIKPIIYYTRAQQRQKAENEQSLASEIVKNNRSKINDF